MPHKDPQARRAYQREYKRGARAGDASNPASIPRLTLLPAGFRLKAASDVVALLEEQIEALRADETVRTLERARCVGYLAACRCERSKPASSLAGSRRSSEF